MNSGRAIGTATASGANGGNSGNHGINGYFIASFSPVKDVYKSSQSASHSNYSSSSSLVSNGSRQQSSQHSTATMVGSSSVGGAGTPGSQAARNGATESTVPVQRSASFNSSCTVPLSISKSTQVKNSASFSNCSLLSKVAKKGSGLTASLTAHPLLRLSSNSATNLLKQQTTNGTSSSANSITNTYSSNITEALANAGSNPRIPAAASATKSTIGTSLSSSTGQLPSPSTASVSSTTSTVTSGTVGVGASSLNQSTSTTALSLAQFGKNSIVDYYV
ncbi:uncharacterized protein LOC131215263 [Anopheles bellator]|uniref:uncharacterized protein LOC131215263 n=1 Tax=Anopheles bellator TaxID=139047 RepID=UPI00264813C6|nr:uncharacterized protein LOC131215263 [Anopheles bellator]